MQRRFKGQGFYQLCARILASFNTQPGKGLPIGSLCSQYWANEYLNGFDRHLQEQLNVSGYCRYMDDIVWWQKDAQTAEHNLQLAQNYLAQQLGLTPKPTASVQNTRKAFTYCGYEIRQGAILPGPRKRQQFKQHLRSLNQAYTNQALSQMQYQQRLTAVTASLGPVGTNLAPLLSLKRDRSRREPRNLVGPNKR